jgi:hypothetical protein
MRTFLKSKKGIAALIATLVVAISAVGAFAYFTTTGSGTGTAAVGTDTPITLSGTTVGSLYPGTSVPASFTATNPSTGHEYVTKVHLVSVDAFTGPGFTNPITVGTGPTQCDTSKFTMSDVTENQDIPAGGPTALAVGGTLNMLNDALNSQDGCKNAVLRMNLTSN